MSDNSGDNEPEVAYFAVIIPVGPTCVEYGHRLNVWDDLVACADCERVAIQAAADRKDPEAAVALFRQWDPKEEPL